MSQFLASEIVSRFIQSLSWMLIHSLWQGLIFTLSTGLLLFFCTKKSAKFRYNLILLHFILFVFTCFSTFLWEWLQFEIKTNSISVRSIFKFENIDLLTTFVQNTNTYFSNNAGIILCCWFIVFAYKVLQTIGNINYLNKARHFKSFNVPLYWQEQIKILSKKIELDRAVTLLESSFINMPMVIGHFKPIILIPIGLLTGLPSVQIKAILLHELAHIRRYDYLINVMQVLVEVIFFFNPSLLWISRLLREERENCCDDLALSVMNNKKEYVTALVSFKEYTLNNNIVPAFSGEGNYLYQRITRIIGRNTHSLKRNDKKFLLTGFLLLLTFFGLTQINNFSGRNDDFTKKLEVQLIPKKIRHNRVSVKLKDQPIAATKTSKESLKNNNEVIGYPSNKKNLEYYKRDVAKYATDQEQYKKDQDQFKLNQRELSKNYEQSTKEYNKITDQFEQNTKEYELSTKVYEESRKNYE